MWFLSYGKLPFTLHISLSIQGLGQPCFSVTQEKKNKNRVSEEKKIENTWEQAAESRSLFSSKVLCLYKKNRLGTLSSIDLSEVDRWFSLLIYSLKLHVGLSNVM